MAASLLLSCVVVSGAAPPGGDGEAGRPNVVLIISDDQGWGDYGFLGSRWAHTPHLDRLAGRSRVFPRGYVPTSLCRPSLASLLTGRYPHAHGVTGNDPAVPEHMGGPRRTWSNRTPAYLDLRRRLNATLGPGEVLPERFAAAGYRTLQTGKWWEGDPRDHGFTHAMTRGDLARGGRHGDAGLAIGRDGGDPPGIDPVPAFLDGCVTDGTPFFVWFAPFLPHTPHDPPPRLLRRYDDAVAAGTLTPAEAKYWANVERWDGAVGALLAELDARGLREDTLIAYVCDNGWITRPAREPGEPAYAPRSKRGPHEGGVRTPILLSRPGSIEPGRVETPVSSLDLFPTLLRAAGLPAPDDRPGVDLLDEAAVRGRGPVFGEIFLHDQPFPAPAAAGLRYRWVIDGRWKLILPHAPNAPAPNAPAAGVALYDLAGDPHETTNLAATHPARVAALTRTLDAWWAPAAGPGASAE